MAKRNTTELAKITRKIRIDCNQVLRDMAEALDMSSSYLSMIESGLRDVPENMVINLQFSYNLSDYVCAQIRAAIEADRKEKNGLADVFEKLEDSNDSSLDFASYSEP